MKNGNSWIGQGRCREKEKPCKTLKEAKMQGGEMKATKEPKSKHFKKERNEVRENEKVEVTEGRSGILTAIAELEICNSEFLDLNERLQHKVKFVLGEFTDPPLKPVFDIPETSELAVRLKNTVDQYRDRLTALQNLFDAIDL